MLTSAQEFQMACHRLVRRSKFARRRFPSVAQKSGILRWKFPLGRLILNDPTAAKNSAADFVVRPTQCLRRSAKKVQKQPQPAPPGCGHPLHPLNEAAVISRGECNHYRIVMFGKRNFLAPIPTAQRQQIFSPFDNLHCDFLTSRDLQFGAIFCGSRFLSFKKRQQQRWK